MTFVETMLWAAGSVLNAALLFTLLYKRRYKDLPWFTAFIACGCTYTVSLYLGYRLGPKHVYAVIYWICDFVDLFMQVSVVIEMAKITMQRSGRWVEGARMRLTLMGASAPFIAVSMALLMKPTADTRLDEIYARSSLFTTILIFSLFVAVVAVSYQLGLGWQTYVMREGYGLIVWVSVNFLTDTLHAYWRTFGYFSLLENIHQAVYLLVLLYWMIAFWLPERATVPKNLNENEILRLESVKRRLEYGQW